MKNQIYIDKEQELNTAILSKIIRYFNSNMKPDIVFHRNYYDGKQRIVNREVEDPSKPNNKIVKNYCQCIVDNFRGYLTGNPITYSPNGDNDIDALLEVLKDNDVITADSEWLKNALIAGVAYELCYVNERTEKKFKNLDSSTSFPIYSTSIDEELLYFVSYTPIVDWTQDAWETRYAVSVYDDTYIYHYECDSTFNNLIIAGEPEEHYFGEVPVAIFNLNDDNKCIFESIISLQDAYNELLSDEVNDFAAFVDAYLILKNITANEEDLAEMKKNRVLLLDADADASYLTKSISDTQVENMLANLNTSIHTVSNSPDFSSEEFNQGVSSGIALQFKLVGFNNIASNIKAQFEKALQKRIHLLNQVFGLVDTAAFDVDIDFTPNLPTSIADTVNIITQLRGLVSDETLLAQLPFIDDVDNEIAKVSAANSFDPYESAFGGVENELPR